MLHFDPTELVRFGGLALIARRVVEGLLAGTHPSPFRGFTPEVADHRPYNPGDDARRIDWRASEKSNRLLVKRSVEESNRTVFLVVDASGSMRYTGRAGPSKFAYAQQVAASLAYLTLAQHDAVGLVVHDATVRQLVPQHTGSKHLLGLLRELETATPGGRTAPADVWHDLATRHLRRRGLVVLLTDGFDQPHRLARALHHLRNRRHEVILFHVLAAEEIEFPFERPTRFRDLEGGEEAPHGIGRRLRAAYRKSFEAYQADLCHRARDIGVHYHRFRTDEPIDRALEAYLAARRRHVSF